MAKREKLMPRPPIKIGGKFWVTVPEKELNIVIELAKDYLFKYLDIGELDSDPKLQRYKEAIEKLEISG